jgi:hypothetical protein
MWVELDLQTGEGRCVARVIFPDETRGALETVPLGARRIVDMLAEIGAAHASDRLSRLEACGAGVVGAGPYAFDMTYEELKRGLERALAAPVTRLRAAAA